MAGPPPMPGSQKQGPTFDWVYLPASGRPGPAPDLPKGRRWSAATKRWWAELWASPQATQWRLDDPELPRLALLHEVTWAAETPSPGLLTEMRQIEDRHGLNPKALMGLRWRIVEDVPKTASAPEVPDEVGERRKARREALTG